MGLRGGWSIVQRDPDLYPHLPLGNLAIPDVAPGFHHLKPPHLALVDFSLGDGVLHRRLNARVGGTNQQPQAVPVVDGKRVIVGVSESLSCETLLIPEDYARCDQSSSGSFSGTGWPVAASADTSMIARVAPCLVVPANDGRVFPRSSADWLHPGFSARDVRKPPVS